MERSFSSAVVTVSDGVSRGTRPDASGDSAEELLREGGFDVVDRSVVPDERGEIEARLTALAGGGIRLVVTTGGTGFGQRDVTPEATRAVIDREAPGLAELMRWAGLAKTPMAALSRGVAGSRGSTLILNLPGSPRGVRESLAAVLPVVSHALELLAGETGEHPTGHTELVTGRAASPPSPLEPPAATGTVVGTAVKVHGSPPCPVGSRIVVGPSGLLGGTLGCAEFDASAVADAPAILAAGVPETRTYHHELGDIEVFFEPRRAPPRLVVVSATPVALELMRLSRTLGYRTVLVEPRADRVTDELRRAADDVRVSLDELELDERVDVVHTDHDAPDVAESLAALLRSPVRFIGVMGSRRHVGPHVEALRRMAFGDEDLARVRSPVGLDVGARTPQEIALSIAAGLLAARSGREGGFLDRWE